MAEISSDAGYLVVNWYLNGLLGVSGAIRDIVNKIEMIDNETLTKFQQSMTCLIDSLIKEVNKREVLSRIHFEKLQVDATVIIEAYANQITKIEKMDQISLDRLEKSVKELNAAYLNEINKQYPRIMVGENI